MGLLPLVLGPSPRTVRERGEGMGWGKEKAGFGILTSTATPTPSPFLLTPPPQHPLLLRP